MNYLPDWNQPGAFSIGRDPLGLQAASVRLYTELLPGLTNVTNRIRYFSFYCWVVRQFELTEHTSDEARWAVFIRRAEAIYALASQIGDNEKAQGMAGSIWASRNSGLTSGQEFDFTPWTDRPDKDGQYLKARRGNFGQFYIASMVEMGMLEEHTTPVYAVTEGYGLEIALAFERACPEACEKTLEAIKSGLVTLEVCQLISAQMHPGYLSDGSEETDLLREYLCGNRQSDPTSMQRRNTLWNILNIIERTNLADANDLRRELYLQENIGHVPEGALRNSLHNWQAYFVNELCHIALELLLNKLAHQINRNSPDTIEEMGTRIVAEFLDDNPGEAKHLSAVAHSVKVSSLKEEHELGLALVDTVAVASNVPGSQDVSDAFRLLLSLWVRWSCVDSFIEIMQPATVAGRSAIGIFRYLDNLADTGADEALNSFTRKFVISNHLLIAGQKLASNGKFTYRFLVDENQLIDGVPAEYGFTNPRIGNLISFARDTGLLDGNEVTAVGKAFLHANQPV